MGNEIISETEEIWGENYTTDSDVVENKYDKFAGGGDYDETFTQWNYVGPETAAAILKNYVPIGAKIMDASCGSGLTGTALKNLGFGNLEGMDISGNQLKLAEKIGAYSKLHKVDMQISPLPFEEGEFDAVNFIGALTYFETNEILKNLCRIVKTGGVVAFSQRDDIMREKNYEKNLAELETLGIWKRTFATEPMPYLPNHPKYGDKIKVQYFVYEVTC